ncbi:MAG: nitroreductase [Bryobacterales bacterium]|nr:nitroreductase [Bryobacterales bacterium]
MVSSDPWSIREQDFPADATRWEQLRFILHYAALAPSSHNTQPWKFRILHAGEGVELYCDSTRGLRVADPDRREMLLSCGAALLNLRLAMEYFGPRVYTTLMPDEDEPDLLARVDWGYRALGDAADRLLFRNIVWRHTDRSPFQDWNIPQHLITELQQEAAKEGSILTFVAAGEMRNRVAALIASGCERQTEDPEFRRELADWVHPNWSEVEDGMPAYAFGMKSYVASAVAPIVLRSFNWGKWAGREMAEMAAAAPALAILSTAEDRPAAWLAAGQALERVLLRACAEGVRASFLNQPVQVQELRGELAAAANLQGTPQLVLRLGYAFHAKATPRRPVAALLC